MNENKPFEHEIDPDLLAEIEEWEKARSRRASGILLLQSRPVSQTAALTVRSSPAQLLL